MMETNEKKNLKWCLVHQKESDLSLELTSTEVTFGRSLSKTFCFESPFLSRNHACMKYNGDKWAIKDEGSTNGVFIGSCRIRPFQYTEVKEGDFVGLGMSCDLESDQNIDLYDKFKKIFVYKLEKRVLTDQNILPQTSTAADSESNSEPEKQLNVANDINNTIMVNVISGNALENEIKLPDVQNEVDSTDVQNEVDSTNVQNEVDSTDVTSTNDIRSAMNEVLHNMKQEHSESPQKMSIRRRIKITPLNRKDVYLSLKADDPDSFDINKENSSIQKPERCLTDASLCKMSSRSFSLPPVSEENNGEGISNESCMQYSQEDEIITISDDDEQIIMKIEDTGTVVKLEHGNLYKQRLQEIIGLFLSDLKNTNIEVAENPHNCGLTATKIGTQDGDKAEIVDRYNCFSPECIQIDDDDDISEDTHEAINKVPSLTNNETCFWPVSSQGFDSHDEVAKNETRENVENESLETANQEINLSNNTSHFWPVLSQGFDDSDNDELVLSQGFDSHDEVAKNETRENVENESREMANQEINLNNNTSHFWPVLSQGFDDSDNDEPERSERDKEANETSAVLNTDAQPLFYKRRIAHQIDRMKQSSRNVSVWKNVIEPPRLKDRRQTESSFTKIRNSKFPKIKEIVKKHFGNRIRAPGGGSAVRMTEAMSNISQLSTITSKKLDKITSTSVTSTSVTDQKSSNEKALAHNIGTTSKVKVYQRAIPSRNDLLRQSIVEKTQTRQPTNKRVSTPNIQQTKKRRLSKEDYSESTLLNVSKSTMQPVVLQNPCTSNVTLTNDAQQNKTKEDISISNKAPPNEIQKKLKSSCESNTIVNKNAGKRVRFNDNKNEVYTIQSATKSNSATTDTNRETKVANSSVNKKWATEFIWDILHWKPAWLREQRNNKNLPPVVNYELLRCVPNSFSSYEHYSNIFAPLIKLETWEKISYDSEVNNASIIQLMIEDVQTDTPRKTTIFTGFGLCKNNDNFELRCGALGIFSINLRNSDNPKKYSSLTVFGHVEVCTNWKLQHIMANSNFSETLRSSLNEANLYAFKLMIRTKMIQSEVLKEKFMQFKIISNLFQDVRLLENTYHLSNKALGGIILNPEVVCDLVPVETRQLHEARTKLNSSQQDAVLGAINMCLSDLNETNVCLIHGPPGTGKTKVIVSIIREILIDQGENVNILVCAPSNGAVNEITERLIKLRGELKSCQVDMHLVRVGQTNSVSDTVKPFTVNQYVLRRFHGQANCENNKDIRYSLNNMQQILKRANVVTTTLGSCNRPEMKDWRHKDVICIIDEATQCVEPEALLALEYPVKKLILVGDHKQLPATVKSRAAVDLKYNKSLFERLHLSLTGKHNAPIFMLNVQYRMHQELCIYPSTTFYNGQLSTAEKLAKLGERFPFATYRFLNLCNGKELITGKSCFSNDGEAEIVLKICKVILEQKHVHIGIITFYSGQKQSLLEKKQSTLQDNEKYVEINTVDAFQGREKDVIILSAVRANENAAIGFTGNTNRLNVALTRARFCLYIVGNVKTLKHNPDWQGIIENARRRNVLRNLFTSFTEINIASQIKK